MASNNSKSIQPLLIQQSRAFEKEDVKYSIARAQFIGYSIYNIIRYSIIGLLIVIANKLNIADTNDYIKYCCACWFISESEQYKNTRFDLSYCIPKCTDCNYCNTQFVNVTDAYNAVDECPMASYAVPNSNVNPNWNDATKCNDNISITSMRYWLKSYIAYSWASCIACSVYIIILIVMTHVERKYISNIYTEFLKWIFIYNIILSEICLYALFKPFQYWNDEINIGVGKNIICEVDSVNEIMEIIFECIIIGAVAFVLIHLFYLIINSSLCGCGCCCTHNDIIDDNASVDTAIGVQLGKDCCQCTRICDAIHKMYWFISWVIIFPFMAVSGICIFYAIYEMLVAGLNADYLIWYHVLIIAAVALLTILSTFDLFIWFRYCYNNALGLKRKDLCVCTCDYLRKE